MSEAAVRKKVVIKRPPRLQPLTMMPLDAQGGGRSPDTRVYRLTATNRKTAMRRRSTTSPTLSMSAQTGNS